MNRHPSRRVAAGLAAGLATIGAVTAVALSSASAASAAPDVVARTASTAGTTSSTGTTSTTSVTSTTGAPADERCELPLPGYVIGDPHLTAGAASGVRVWHDTTGWHLRATHPGTAAVVFTGTVHSGQPITAHGYRLEAHDQLGFSRDRRTLTFRLTNHGAVDGIDFTDRCAVHTGFSLSRGGTRLPTEDAFLGAGGTHPAAVPFTVYRHHG